MMGGSCRSLLIVVLADAGGFTVAGSLSLMRSRLGFESREKAGSCVEDRSGLRVVPNSGTQGRGHGKQNVCRAQGQGRFKENKEKR